MACAFGRRLVLSGPRQAGVGSEPPLLAGLLELTVPGPLPEPRTVRNAGVLCPVYTATLPSGNESCRAAGIQHLRQQPEKPPQQGGTLKPGRKRGVGSPRVWGEGAGKTTVESLVAQGVLFPSSWPENETRTPSQLGVQTARGFPASPGEGSPAPQTCPVSELIAAGDQM